MPTAPTAVSGATSSRPALPVPPLHISHENLPRKTLGYNPKATAELFDEVAETYRRLWDEYERLRAERAGADERLEALRAVLAEERKQHEAAAERAEQLQNELERANSGRQALELMLQQSKAQLDVAQTEDAGGPERVAELETALEDAEQRAAHANERLEATEQELARFRDQEHSLAEALVWARHTASELTEKAQAEAEALVQDAQRRAAQLVAEGQREVERLAGERNRLESLTSEVQEDLAQFLLGALDRLKERAGSTTPSEEFAE